MGCAAPRLLFFLLIVKPFLLLVAGIKVRRRDRLPQRVHGRAGRANLAPLEPQVVIVREERI